MYIHYIYIYTIHPFAAVLREMKRDLDSTRPHSSPWMQRTRVNAGM